MDIFVRNVPKQATRKQIERFFQAPLAEYGIDVYHCEKIRDKTLATITVLDTLACQHFLGFYGVPANAPLHVRAKKPLFWSCKIIICSRSRTDPRNFDIQALAYEASQRAAQGSAGAPQPRAQPQSNRTLRRFAIKSLQCGTWDYAGNRLAFTSHYHNAKPGMVTFGVKEAIILLGHIGNDQSRIDLSYFDCDNIIIGTYEEPAVSFSLTVAPRFYEIAGTEVLSAALLNLTLAAQPANKKIVKKTRLTGIDANHAKLAGLCFVYRVTLSNYNELSTVRTLLLGNPKMPAVVNLQTPRMAPIESLDLSFTRLDRELTDTKRFGGEPFALRYQLYRLAKNGMMSPLKVIELLPKVKAVSEAHGLSTALDALRRFSRQVPFAGPEIDVSVFSKRALEDLLEQCAVGYDPYASNNAYELAKRYAHINLVHKVIITPCATYLEGPEPEPTNRVLRRYKDHSDSFLRVIFQDEGGGSVRYDPRSSNQVIYHERFKGVLDGTILIAGQGFAFLGFSHSSLRSQSCWFMAPLIRDKTLAFAPQILKELGNFEDIQCAPKCAARIGQNFTDTNATVDLTSANVSELMNVERNGRDFSDGCGTISMALLRKVWEKYGTRRLLKPNLLQIRFQGYKGMVSLDTRLSGMRLMLRANMKKFETKQAWNLEICGAAFRPLPMVLNRPLIKILEDLWIPASVFLDLQGVAVSKLRDMTTSAINAATFLDDISATKATRIPQLLKDLGFIGLQYQQDDFLYSIVEMAVIAQLREIKYRARIPVAKGHTLYGIVDETGTLKEREVFVITETAPEGGQIVHAAERVVVTRSPAMHPGDVQIARAVGEDCIPKSHPLHQLSNAVVFSQFGARDLPSQLSGGDLDGDLYNVIFDERMVPHQTVEPADYPRVPPVDLGRPVTIKDMSNFLIEFMETDQLGMISNIHQQLADQCETGTFDPACITLAGMASTAVDFSKTGIAVDMSQCPRYNRCRPDFMSPSPRIGMTDEGNLEVEDLDDQDDAAFEDLDAERRPFRYYESHKVLGQLFRNIDERQFLRDMQQQRRLTSANASSSSSSVLARLWKYMRHWAAQYGILYEHYKETAREIRGGYEDNLLDILYYNSPTANVPLTEIEVFSGTILGRHGGAQGKPLRELSKNMRERFEPVVEYARSRMLKGDAVVQAVNDLEELFDVKEREIEALPRAIACLSVALDEAGCVDRLVGELKSFRYIAAATCLEELLRYRITTFGSYLLPKLEL